MSIVADQLYEYVAETLDDAPPEYRISVSEQLISWLQADVEMLERELQPQEDLPDE